MMRYGLMVAAFVWFGLWLLGAKGHANDEEECTAAAAAYQVRLGECVIARDQCQAAIRRVTRTCDENQGEQAHRLAEVYKALNEKLAECAQRCPER